MASGRWFQACSVMFPGRSAARSGALQTRDRRRLRARSGPGSAMHRFTLHRIRETSISAIFPAPATSRQSCGPFERQHDLLTRILKPIATALWQGCVNRAATVRGEFEFRGVTWKPAGSLPGRAARGQSLRGSTPSPCPCGSPPPTKRPTSGFASSTCIASAWCCAARCAASAWRSTCRSRPIAASPSA